MRETFRCLSAGECRSPTYLAHLGSRLTVRACRVAPRARLEEADRDGQLPARAASFWMKGDTHSLGVYLCVATASLDHSYVLRAPPAERRPHTPHAGHDAGRRMPAPLPFTACRPAWQRTVRYDQPAEKDRQCSPNPLVLHIPPFLLLDAVAVTTPDPAPKIGEHQARCARAKQ